MSNFPPITNAAHILLIVMDQAEREKRFEDAELVGERNEWWVGNRRTSWRTVKQLLERCLIRSTGGNLGDSCERYEINEHGRAALLDKTYVPPELVAALNAE
jgi:hypothetical protein